MITVGLGAFGFGLPAGALDAAALGSRGAGTVGHGLTLSEVPVHHFLYQIWGVGR